MNILLTAPGTYLYRILQSLKYYKQQPGQYYPKHKGSSRNTSTTSDKPKLSKSKFKAHIAQALASTNQFGDDVSSIVATIVNKIYK